MNDEWFAVPEKRSLSIRAHLRSTPLEERAPIVFVVHGFGGIVLKQVRDSVDLQHAELTGR